MSGKLTYKGYHASVEFDAESKILFGKIDGIRDLITFESESASEIENEFRSAVDDYLALCAHLGQEPDKEYSGVFNVRIPQDDHKKLSEIARKKECTLNAVVTEAIDQYIKQDMDPLCALEDDSSSPESWKSLDGFKSDKPWRVIIGGQSTIGGEIYEEAL